MRFEQLAKALLVGFASAGCFDSGLVLLTTGARSPVHVILLTGLTVYVLYHLRDLLSQVDWE